MNRKDKRILQLQYRIKELENILCPGEQHDYVTVDCRTYEMDSSHDMYRVEKQVCQRCYKTREVEVY